MEDLVNVVVTSAPNFLGLVIAIILLRDEVRENRKTIQEIGKELIDCLGEDKQ